jgi:hypothetical protein
MAAHGEFELGKKFPTSIAKVPSTQKASYNRRLINKSSQENELMVLKDIHQINSKIKHAIENRNL